jgi:Rrf2 family protein
MLLSATSRQAISALTYLACEGEGASIPAHRIARAVGAPELSLRKVLPRLAAAGLLRSVRGPNGGNALARPGEAITLLEAVEAIDGPIGGEVPRCVPRDREMSAVDERLQAACERAADALRTQLKKVRISDLAGACRGK